MSESEWKGRIASAAFQDYWNHVDVKKDADDVVTLSLWKDHSSAIINEDQRTELNEALERNRLVEYRHNFGEGPQEFLTITLTPLIGSDP